MRKINVAVLALIIANLIWGGASPIFKFALQNLPPFTLAYLRFLLACLLMYPFIHEKLAWSDLKNKHIWWYGLLGISFNIGFFFMGIERTSSINAPIIGSSGPIFILLGSFFFLKEKIKKNTILGLLLAFVGILVIILEPILKEGIDGQLAGNLMLVVATLSSVGSTLVGRKYIKDSNLINFTFWAFFIGAISFFPFSIYEYVNNPFWVISLDYRGIVGIVFGSIFSSVIGYYCYNFALSKLPAFQAGVFSYMDPVIAILIAYPLLGEKPTGPYLIGAILVFIGIIIAEKRLHWHPIHKLFNKI